MTECNLSCFVCILIGPMYCVCKLGYVRARIVNASCESCCAARIDEDSARLCNCRKDVRHSLIISCYINTFHGLHHM